MDGFGEGRHGDGWSKGRKTKLTESYGENFCTVATSNREKPKEDELKICFFNDNVTTWCYFKKT